MYLARGMSKENNKFEVNKTYIYSKVIGGSTHQQYYL